MRLSRQIAVVATAAGLAVAAACGTDYYTGPTGPVDIDKDNFASSLGINIAAMTKNADGVYYQDKVQGTGPTIAKGDSVGVFYAGYLSNGAQFDSNMGSTDTLRFRVGTTGIIPGFSSAIVGMNEGGRRLAIVPSSLAYGSSGNGAGIPRYANLVFDLVVAKKY